MPYYNLINFNNKIIIYIIPKVWKFEYNKKLNLFKR